MLKIEYRNIEELIPYIRNSRTHSDVQVAQIAASIREFGWTNPVLVDGENGIIAGHGRVMAARKLGQNDIPVIELAVRLRCQMTASREYRERRASMPPSFSCSISRPNCTANLGFVYAPCASNMAFRSAPKRGNLAASEIAFCQSPASIAAVTADNFVSMC